MANKIAYKNLLFDLDGTLTDSCEGIFYAFKKTFASLGVPSPTDAVLKSYIGPPLSQTFALYFDQKTAFTAREIFRGYYHEKGAFMNRVYDGVPDMLSALKDRGYKLFLCTSKNKASAIDTLKEYQLYDFFDGIYGADKNLNIDTKTEVLTSLLTSEALIKSDCILIGDTKYDHEGAKNVGIDIALVEYGYGSEDFHDLSANYKIKDVQSLKNLFLHI